jgi:hypothetical protein
MTLKTPTVTVHDRRLAALCIARGCHLVNSITGPDGWTIYTMSNDDGLATAILDEWAVGSAMVDARLLIHAWHQVRKATPNAAR